ncbi:MAG TPA: cytochrome C [Bacteroidales bacterium]|nr:cytochrome C [Bacteroidales bacterium]HCU20779.1 cytochrome C [Bacteroidales bacterium]
MTFTMMMRKKLMQNLVISLIIVLSQIPISCDTNRNSRGYEYFPDMVYSRAYETYAPNPVLPNGMTAQPPVKGTIPVNMVPYQYPKTPEGLRLAGLELINPVEPNEENIARGKFEYNVFCANCHGIDGRGDGNLYANGKYPSEPPSLITEDMLSRPDGEFFHIITLGSAIMGPFASLIRSEDKWKVILYIKKDLSGKN